MTELADHPSQPLDKRAPLVSEPSRVRACDLFRVFSRAADEAAAEANAGGLALSLRFDPALRNPRLACPSTVARVAKSTIYAIVHMTRRGAVCMSAGIGPSGDHVTMSVSSRMDPSMPPDARMLRLASDQARELGGKLMVECQETQLILSLVFPAEVSPMTVLLIEKDWQGRRDSIERLTDAGFRVETAEDGEAALRASSGTAYVAVLADLYMEDEDTLALVTRLRVANGSVPVFALARDGAGVTGWALAQAGFAGVVESPVSPGALRMALASVEAAELEAVQAGEDGEEDGNDQDGGHGRSGSERLRSA